MVPEQTDLAATQLTAIRKQAAALSFAPVSLARMTRLTVPDQQQGASLAIEWDGNVMVPDGGPRLDAETGGRWVWAYRQEAVPGRPVRVAAMRFPLPVSWDRRSFTRFRPSSKTASARSSAFSIICYAKETWRGTC
jgi:hypothetical protein